MDVKEERNDHLSDALSPSVIELYTKNISSNDHYPMQQSRSDKSHIYQVAAMLQHFENNDRTDEHAQHQRAENSSFIEL